MLNIKYFICVVLVLINFCYAEEFQCWDCNAFDKGKCVDPNLSNAKTTLCDEKPLSEGQLGYNKRINKIEKLEVAPRNEAVKPVCFTYYFKAEDSSQTGIYRGCAKVPISVKSECDFIKEESSNGEVTNCEICRSDQCNTKNLGSSATNYVMSLGLFLSSAISLWIINFD